MELEIYAYINKDNSVSELYEMDVMFNHSIDDAYTPYNERPETYIIPVVFGVIFIVGILGNGTLCLIFMKHRTMRNIPNTYIFSLALADLLVILICVPLTSIVYTFESWPWGVTLCRLTEAAKDTSIGVSVFTLTALSADRYCAVVNPLRKLQTRSLTVVIAISIWVAAIICALPGAIISNVVTETDNNHTIQYCSPFGAGLSSNSTANYKKYSTVTKALVYYVIPLIIIAILYALMAHRLHSSARELIGENVGTQSRAQQQARKHVANMVITFIVIFFICFLPYHIFQLWFHLDPNSLDDYDSVWHVVRMVGFCLSFINSCINPVALYCVSGVFRQHFQRYLCCRRYTLKDRNGLSIACGQETTMSSTIRRSTIHGPNFMRQTGHGCSTILKS